MSQSIIYKSVAAWVSVYLHVIFATHDKDLAQDYVCLYVSINYVMQIKTNKHGSNQVTWTEM